MTRVSMSLVGPIMFVWMAETSNGKCWRCNFSQISKCTKKKMHSSSKSPFQRIHVHLNINSHSHVFVLRVKLKLGTLLNRVKLLSMQLIGYVTVLDESWICTCRWSIMFNTEYCIKWTWPNSGKSTVACGSSFDHIECPIDSIPSGKFRLCIYWMWVNSLFYPKYDRILNCAEWRMKLIRPP